MRRLTFSVEGVCRITLSGIPEPAEMEDLVEEYVANVEVKPHPMHLIFIDISKLVHMAARQRQIFSELITQASQHYGGHVELVIAGGSLNLRRFLELFCKSIGFRGCSHIFEDVAEAHSWIERWFENTTYVDNKFSAQERG